MSRIHFVVTIITFSTWCACSLAWEQWMGRVCDVLLRLLNSSGWLYFLALARRIRYHAFRSYRRMAVRT